MKKLQFDDDIYKAYKHGSSIKSILKDFKISLKFFLKNMHEQGGYAFHPDFFDKKRMRYRIIP